MPIPNFDSNSVLPPHIGDPTRPDHLSPYPCTSLELCQRFSITAVRKTILQGFLAFREKLNTLGVIQGFQWLDGSFLEDIEKTQSRPPNDLDVVTFYIPATPAHNNVLVTNFPEFKNSLLSKQNYRIDHFPVDINFNPLLTVEMVRYWSGLFSHRRDQIWKGMLRIELNTPSIDADAKNYLMAQP